MLKLGVIISSGRKRKIFEMSADDKEQNKFDDLLKNQELTNSITVGKELIPEAESGAVDDILEGTWPLVFE